MERLRDPERAARRRCACRARYRAHPLGQHLHHDRRRRHRQRAAQRKRAGEPDVEVAADQRSRRRASPTTVNTTCAAPRPSTMRRIASQLRKRKLQANRKHQEHDAELGEIARVRAVGQQRQARAGRPECRRSDMRAAAADAAGERRLRLRRRRTAATARTQDPMSSISRIARFIASKRAPRAKPVPEESCGVLSLALINSMSVTSPSLVATPGALALAREVLQIEAQAVAALTDRIDGAFSKQSTFCSRARAASSSAASARADTSRARSPQRSLPPEPRRCSCMPPRPRMAILE